MSSISHITTPNWLSPDGQPVVIAGPCSAESEAQVMRTAEWLREQVPQLRLFRAGVWKPRTRPNSFEGMGPEALPWLRRVREELGLPITIEVANAEHVRLALDAGIDVLWLGARTTVNPFSVQEIADALEGVDIPVMVKNPINPDLQLWIGAMERLQKAGITRLAAIHRGFSTHGKSEFRNEPQWHIPIELKRALPEIPLICDPSHICGNRTLLADVSQRALDLQMQGIMIETHPDPDNAWSDQQQQVTPDRLREILDDLVFRREQSEEVSFEAQLEEYRKRIDLIDSELINLMAERMDISRMIGHLKKNQKVTILQIRRWDEMIRRRLVLASRLGLGEDFSREMFELIHEESINLQNAVMNKQRGFSAEDPA
ncbi:MAG: bifunctional 3-deoxy-7-phosphoheptulonate synthase/chorismate mutase type II [Bacteroidetes bacterium]|nr:bifunctional 3-deoxy-7-phosphoheptulonate synthase/chorismate mutase type II [Bacteroidota bacterium]